MSPAWSRNYVFELAMSSNGISAHESASRRSKKVNTVVEGILLARYNSSCSFVVMLAVLMSYIAQG